MLVQGENTLRLLLTTASDCGMLWVTVNLNKQIMKIQVGTITLKKQYQFTQYSEYAAWTDYVTCQPQTVPLYRDDYWVFASFDGVLSSTTFDNRDGYRKLGQPWKAHVQTQKFGGIGHWMDSELYRVELAPAYTLAEHGVYGPDCGEAAGKTIVSLIDNDVVNS